MDQTRGGTFTIGVQHIKHGFFFLPSPMLSGIIFHSLSKDSGHLFLALWSQILSSKKGGLRGVDFLVFSPLFLQAGYDVTVLLSLPRLNVPESSELAL